MISMPVGLPAVQLLVTTWPPTRNVVGACSALVPVGISEGGAEKLLYFVTIWAHPNSATASDAFPASSQYALRMLRRRSLTDQLMREPVRISRTQVNIIT